MELHLILFEYVHLQRVCSYTVLGLPPSVDQKINFTLSRFEAFFNTTLKAT